MMDYTNHAQTAAATHPDSIGVQFHLLLRKMQCNNYVSVYTIFLHCGALLVSNVFLLCCSSSDEEKVGPWPRGPIFPFRKKALQRLRVSEVKHSRFHPEVSQLLVRDTPSLTCP